MAASNPIGGYNCKFVNPISEDLVCKVCNLVAREPNLTSCCGNHFCHTCISQVQQDKKPCPEPTCQEPQFTVFLNKGLQKKILALRVHCTMEDRGCQWNGKLEHLNAHLNVNSGDCQYVDIECPEKCGQQVQKHQLAIHIANECPKREFTCMHCGFKATYEVVSEKHWPECQNYPVPCPNRCQIGAVERNTLEDHLNMCSLQVVDCDFSYAGCNEKLQRQHMEKHVEENTQKHLALVAAASMKMSQELQEQRDEFQEYMEQKERETADLRQQLQQKDRQIEKSLQGQQQAFQKEIERIGAEVQGKLREKQQQIEAQNIQIVQVKQDHGKALKEQIIQVKQDCKEQIELVEERREKQIKSLEVRSQQQTERIGKLEKKLQEQRDEFQEYLEQKERETADLRQQLQQKDSQIEKSLQEQQQTLQKEIERVGNEVRGELREKQQQIEAQIVQVKQDHEEALKEQIVQLKQDHEERIKAVEQRREKQIKSLEVQSQQQVERIEKQLQRKEQELEQLNMKLGMPPFHFTMSNFNELITKDNTQTSINPYMKMRWMFGKLGTSWYSPHMYTHTYGYKFCIRVWPNGYNGAHVSVELTLMSGEFDATLHWPAKFTITLQLLNQHRDQDHITVTKQFQWYKPDRGIRRVGDFDREFVTVAHTDLNWNAQKQTQYLKDDCLHFRVTEIEV